MQFLLQADIKYPMMVLGYDMNNISQDQIKNSKNELLKYAVMYELIHIT